MKFSTRFSPVALSAALLSALLTLGPAQAVSFGGLNVTPRGAQNLNLETGATELPSGGTATDTKSGLVLTGAKMQLKPNESLTAQGATIKLRRGGTLSANNVVYDLKNNTVTATGNVTYSDTRMAGLSASQVVLYVKSGFVVASGSVKAAKPSLSAERFVFDPNTMQAALSGPYSLKSGGKSFSGAAGQNMLLNFSANMLTSVKPQPSAVELGRFAGYLK
ncbi:hypothetical protein Dxin01_01383 [Deinococcus xinjiangensis]|uniref:OstA family protein n=1 Tax=Deinococcus xinjiangensis TaxID=457454 RepID=A0ABP9V8Q3_9DEIO